MWVIEGGLGKDEKVVVKGLQRVRPGVKVDPELVPMPTRSDETAKAKPALPPTKPTATKQPRKAQHRTETGPATEN